MPPKSKPRTVKPTLPNLQAKAVQLATVLMSTVDQGAITIESPLTVELYSSIKDIVLQEKHKTQTTAKQATKEERIKRFQSWLQSKGFNTSDLPVEISSFDEFGLGLKATRPISVDDLVFTVPSNLILTSEEAKQRLTEQGFSPDITELADVSLAVYLWHESTKSDSPWKPYIDILPRDFSTTWFWTLDELAQLPDRLVTLRAIVVTARHLIEYSRIFKFLSTSDKLRKNIEKFTFEQYRWARAVIETRRNILPNFVNGPAASSYSSSSSSPSQAEGPQNVVTLIPFWDLINHSTEAAKISSFYEPELHGLVFKSTLAYNQGDQVFMYYGDRSNQELLEHSGFVINDNPIDTFDFSIRLVQEDVLVAAKTAVLKINKLPLTSTVTVRLGKVDFNAAFFRLVVCNKDQLLSLKSKLPTEIISTSNEIVVYHALINNLQNVTEEFKTSRTDPITCRDNILRLCRQFKQSRVKLLETGLVLLYGRFQELMAQSEQEKQALIEAETALLQETSRLTNPDEDFSSLLSSSSSSSSDQQ